MGFNTVWVVEHHFRDGRSASPCSEAILGGLALSTEQIKMGFGVTLMPFGFIHPARVAEKVATVDILSKGRVEWGTGRSTPMEQTAFGVPTDDRSRDQWREAGGLGCPPRRPPPRRGGGGGGLGGGRGGEGGFPLHTPGLPFPGGVKAPQAVPGPPPASVAGGRRRPECHQRRPGRHRAAVDG